MVELLKNSFFAYFQRDGKCINLNPTWRHLCIMFDYYYYIFTGFKQVFFLFLISEITKNLINLRAASFYPQVISAGVGIPISSSSLEWLSAAKIDFEYSTRREERNEEERKVIMNHAEGTRFDGATVKMEIQCEVRQHKKSRQGKPDKRI